MQSIAGKKTLIGIMWMLFSTGIGKFATLITQVVLGWLLTKEDFGLYALALSVSSSVSLLRNGGTNQILIQKGTEFNELAPSIFKFSLIFNLTACIILLILSPVVAVVYGAVELKVMLSVIAISILLMTPFGVLRAKLIINHRFKEISIIGLFSNVIRQGSTVVCALIGLGYMSFIWPILFEPVVLFLVSYYYVREWIKRKRLTLIQFKKIFFDAKWVMLGNLAIALFSAGQYFVIGLFESRENLGIYFFGFQLIIAVSAILINVIETVFLPLFSSMENKQFKDTYLNVIYYISALSLIVSVIGFLNVNWVIDLAWDGKWNQAILIVQVLILTMPAVLLSNFNKVVMESKGLWDKRLINLTCLVIGDIAVAGITSWKYDIYTTAIMVCCYRNFFSFVQCLWIAKILKIRVVKVLESIVPNVLLMLFLTFGVILFIDYVGTINIEALNDFAISILVVFWFFIFNIFFEKNKIIFKRVGN